MTAVPPVHLATNWGLLCALLVPSTPSLRIRDSPFANLVHQEPALVSRRGPKFVPIMVFVLLEAMAPGRATATSAHSASTPRP